MCETHRAAGVTAEAVAPKQKRPPVVQVQERTPSPLASTSAPKQLPASRAAQAPVAPAKPAAVVPPIKVVPTPVNPVKPSVAPEKVVVVAQKPTIPAPVGDLKKPLELPLSGSTPTQSKSQLKDFLRNLALIEPTDDQPRSAVLTWRHESTYRLVEGLGIPGFTVIQLMQKPERYGLALSLVRTKLANMFGDSYEVMQKPRFLTKGK